MEDKKIFLDEGDIVFARGRGLGSWLIRWATNGAVDHVAYSLGQKLLIETNSKYGVTYTSVEKYLDKKKYEMVAIGRIRNMSEEDTQKMSEWLVDQIGEKYDHLQIFAMGWHRLFGSLGNRTHIDREKLDVCSTLLAKDYWEVRHRLFNPHVHVSNHSPSDIYFSKDVQTGRNLI